MRQGKDQREHRWCGIDSVQIADDRFADKQFFWAFDAPLEQKADQKVVIRWRCFGQSLPDRDDLEGQSHVVFHDVECELLKHLGHKVEG